jgi:hypothetical protein
MRSLFFFILFFSTSLLANPIPSSKETFCGRYDNNETIKTLSNDQINLISFKNHGGLFNGGVCWWHSKFQRHLLYLTIFKPYESLPTKEEIKKIVHNIRLGNQVVAIPGYYNAHDFTSENKNTIQKELEAWQIYDGVILSQWIDGISGTTKVSPKILQQKMDLLFQYVETKKKIAYVKLQIKGITSHAWLVVAVKTAPHGFELEYIDSNRPQELQTYNYKIGDDSFYIKEYGNFVPYLEYTKEEARIFNIGKKFCESVR